MSSMGTQRKWWVAGAAVAAGIAGAPALASAQTRPGCESCPSSCQPVLATESFGGYVTNAVKGDLMLDWGESVTRHLLDGVSNQMGWGTAQFTHSGVFTKGGAEVTHNTMFIDRVALMLNAVITRFNATALQDYLADFTFNNIGLGAVVLDGAALAAGVPGTHTANAALETGDGGALFWARPSYLGKPKDEGAKRYIAFRAANQELQKALPSNHHKYSVHAFMNPTGELTGKRSVCSLDLQDSITDAGYQQSRETYTAAAVQAGTNAGWTFIKNQAKAAVEDRVIKCVCLGSGSCTVNYTTNTWSHTCNWLGYTLLRVRDVPGGTTLADNVGTGIANQVTNCFKNGGGAGVNCSDYSSTSWQSMPGTTTIIPDTLVKRGLANNNYKNTVVQASFATSGTRTYDTGNGVCGSKSQSTE